MFFTPRVVPLILDTLMYHMVLSFGGQMGVMWQQGRRDTPSLSFHGWVACEQLSLLTILSDSSQNTAHTQAETQVFQAPQVHQVLQ